MPRAYLTRLRALWPLAAVGAAQAILFVPFALRRFVDPDEGWYGFGAVRALRGDVPYVDFFYPQMPLLPYVYGAWTTVFGDSWHAERVCSAVLAVAVGVLVYAYARRVSTLAAALAATAAYATSALVFVWFATIKTYALTALLLVGALVLLDRPRPRLLAAGLLSGLAVASRLLAAAALPAYVFVVWRRGRSSTASFTAGALAGLAPALVLLAWDPGAFVFDNLGYHSARSSGGLVGDLPQKAHVVGNLFGLGATDTAAGLQFLGLVLVALWAAAASLVLARRVPLPLAVAGLLGVASIVPTPAYVQYYSLTVPFLVLGIVEAFPLLRRSVRAVAGRLVVACAAAAAIAYGAAAAVDVRDYDRSRAEPGANIAAVEDVADAVKGQVRPGEAVLTTWPGYLIGTPATTVDGTGLANFVLDATERLSSAQIERNGLKTTAAVERLIRAGAVRVIVFRPWAPSNGPRWPDVIGGSGYRLVSTVGTARIYRLGSG